MANDNMLKGLFVNTAKANCSIHESGKMCFNCLKLSSSYTLDYQEVDESSRTISLDYDFYVFNYHEYTMGWLDTPLIRELPGFKATIVLEVLPGNPFVMCPKGDFDAYLVLDPTLSTIENNVHPFSRPLETPATVYEFKRFGIPVIGTFGFATKGKGFDKVIEAVNKEFDEAHVRINIPKGDYVSDDALNALTNELQRVPTKGAIKVEITHHFYEKEELIKWCSENTLNVFLYNRNIQGLSATTDQAIASGRPMAVSSDPTFRHIHKYLTPYPFQSLKQSIADSEKIISKIKEDWAPVNFARKFEDVITYHRVKPIAAKTTSPYILPAKEKTSPGMLSRLKITDFVPPVITKAKRKLLKSASHTQPVVHKTLDPYVHYGLSSFSQHNEDLLIDLLLSKKDKGVYVDIGANHPTFNSNTKRFYLRGWTGINIEPNVKAYNDINEARARDINLNIAISNEENELVFYQLGDDSTLSTLDFATANKMAKMVNLPVSSTKVKTMPLKKVLDEYNTGHIDFMSVDAEGHDLAVLTSNDWERFRPSLVMVESNNEFRQILEFMDGKDYLHVFSNFYNAIFLDKRSKDPRILENLNWHES